MTELYALGIGFCAGGISGILYVGIAKNGVVDLTRRINMQSNMIRTLIRELNYLPEEPKSSKHAKTTRRLKSIK